MKSAVQPVREVGVVFKTHLDLGFTDLADAIVRRYLSEYIPAALELARSTRERPHRFVWTTGSWLVHRFLETASPAGRRAMEEAIRAGDFHWHALPFTTHTEFMDADLFRLGLVYSKILDKRFGRVTRGAKMTDVPGHTIGMVPLLAEAGVRFLHLGVNPASTVPGVPPLFVWRHGKHEIVVAYEADYGGVTRIPGGKALCVNLTGDNLGPQNPGEIDKVYERLKAEFPGARLVPGGIDVMADALWRKRAELPVITAEIGDTWIHGVGTDPQKAARYRELCRLRQGWIADGRMEAGGAADLKFGESLLLTAEHTWGMDLKTHLKDWKNYTPARFARMRGEMNFKKVESSWAEQRRYGDRAVAALPAELRAEAKAALKTLAVRTPSCSGWKQVEADGEFALGGLRLALDPATGGICRLAGVADARHPIATLTRHVYSADDYERFYGAYIREEADWSRKDFTKPGLPASVKAGVQAVTVASLELHADGRRARAGLRFTAAARRAGAAVEVWLELEAREEGALALALTWRGKPAVRLPEAYWLTFAPKLAKGARWRFKKLGVWIDPRDVVKGGNRWLHAVDGEVRAGAMTIETLDAALVAPERGRLLEFDGKLPRTDAAVSFNLYNNKWGTNFPMWNDEDARFRFVVRW
jgi:hypothetical protein